MNENQDTARHRRVTIDKGVGSRVRQALHEASVAEAAVADLLGISRIHLLDMLEGRMRCSPVALQIIALVTGKGVAWFFLDPKDPSAALAVQRS